MSNLPWEKLFEISLWRAHPEPGIQSLGCTSPQKEKAALTHVGGYNILGKLTLRPIEFTLADTFLAIIGSPVQAINWKRSLSVRWVSEPSPQHTRTVLPPHTKNPHPSTPTGTQTFRQTAPGTVTICWQGRWC